jgi:hypothetical protein
MVLIIAQWYDRRASVSVGRAFQPDAWNVRLESSLVVRFTDNVVVGLFLL